MIWLFNFLRLCVSDFHVRLWSLYMKCTLKLSLNKKSIIACSIYFYFICSDIQSKGSMDVFFEMQHKTISCSLSTYMYHVNEQNALWQFITLWDAKCPDTVCTLASIYEYCMRFWHHYVIKNDTRGTSKTEGKQRYEKKDD